MKTISSDKPFRVHGALIKTAKIVPAHTAFELVYTAANALIPACQTLAVAELVNTVEGVVSGGQTQGRLLFPLFVMLMTVIFSNMMPSVENLVNVSRENKLKKSLKAVFLKKQTSLAYRYIENDQSCELIHRVCDKPEQRFGEGLQNCFNGLGLLIKIISLLAIVMQADWISGIVILAVCIPLFYLAETTGKRNYSLEKDALDLKRKYTYLAEVLSSREYAKERNLFGYSQSVEKRYEDMFQSANKKESQIEKKRYANMKSGSLITVGIAVIIMLILLPAVREERMTSGLYIALAGAILSLVQSMSWTLSDIVLKHVRWREYVKEVGIFLDMEEKKDADATPVEIPEFHLDSIEFCNVSFRYPGEERYVLRECSFKLDGDKCYSFVGENGAGKTTITKLLVGMYDNFEGEIRINGRRIQEYDFSEIKWMFSVVFQDFAKYALSVRDNISLGKIDCTDRQLLERVSAESGMDEIIQKLPNGADSLLGKMDENSVDLSGGQWQKLAIARLLYRDSPVNILDEPTASLDPKAEAKIYETFGRVNQNRFTIFITHRLGAARLSDEILVLEHGKIAEQGTHEQLMEYENGIYREMFESQRCWYEA